MDTAAIFEDLYDALEEQRCQIRVSGKTVIVRALCPTSGGTVASSDQGNYPEPEMSLRLLLAEELPAASLQPKTPIEIQLAGATSWKKYRVNGRYLNGAVLRLTLEAINA